MGAEKFDKLIEERFGGFGTRGFDETGPAALAAVRIQRELRDGKNPPAGVEEGTIKTAGSIESGKYAQVDDFLCHGFECAGGIAFACGLGV